MTDIKTPAASGRPVSSASLQLLTLSALGVVFGDIGTSPLYTLKTVLDLTGPHPAAAAAMGSLSLILWTLIIVTTIKYVNFAMRIDNDGEGGILALMSLLGVKLQSRPFLITLGLAGAALIYGDGAITPAISVLSALEGLIIVDHSFTPYVLPTTLLILILLFCIQRFGTAFIGKAFGPVMLCWFVTMGILGLWGISNYPSVLWALNPMYGIAFLHSGGLAGFLVLGGVFLCVTGAEALYADMGHFGAPPIRRAWAWVVFPSLVLNYAGQAALVLQGAPTSDNIFYRLCPPAFMIPMVILSTIATIIASQSIITGAFSMTRQAIQLGWMPRLKIVQTSAEGYGQIYVRAVNWLLMLVTCGLVLAFRKSDNLASAYGIAVSATMLATSVLLYVAMREIWNWGRLKAGAVAGTFILVDMSFFLANLSKIASGGYVPLILAAFVYGTMYIWHRGAQTVAAQIQESIVPVDAFMQDLAEHRIARVPGTAVFLTRSLRDVPPVMAWHVKCNRALQEHLFVLTVTMESRPWVSGANRMEITRISGDFWRASAHFGFMQRPNIPALLKQAQKNGCSLDLSDVIYYVGHETVMSRTDGKAMPAWMTAIYAFMQRNCVHASDYFLLPADNVVEIGRQILI